VGRYEGRAAHTQAAVPASAPVFRSLDQGRLTGFANQRPGVLVTPLFEEQQACRKSPRISGADTGAKFQEVQQAYETLGNPQRRRDYDVRRLRGGRPQRSRHPAGRAEAPRASGAADAGWRAELGAVLHLELRLSPLEAARGGDLAVELPALTRCPACGGRGHYWVSVCRSCHGQGHGVGMEAFTLHVPPGVRGGQTFALSLEGLGLLHRGLVIHAVVH
jgi:hypothetical protein